MRAPIAVGLLILLGLARARDARADSPEREAARHFQAAIEHVDAGAYREAIAEFLQAYELRPHYSVLYNLALAYSEAGQHTLSIATFERYLDQGKEHLSEARTSAVRDLIAEQKKQLAQLEVHVRPDSATVLVDGVEVRPASDGTLALDPGTRELVVRAPGHEPHASRVELTSGKRTPIDVSLTPSRGLAPSRSLRIACAIPDVTVDVDGQVLGVTDGKTELRSAAPASSHELRFSRRGYTSRSVALNGARADEAVNCAPLLPSRDRALPAAQLIVSVSEPGALQTLDGAPFSGQPLVPGRHLLTVTRAGFLPQSQLVTLAPGRVLRLAVRLEPTREHRSEYEHGARTRRTLAYVAGAGAVGFGLGALALKIHNDNRYDTWKDTTDSLPPRGAPESDDQTRQRKKNDALASSIRTLDGVTIGFAVGSAALLGTAAWLYLSSPPDRYSGTGAWTWAITGTGVSARHEF